MKFLAGQGLACRGKTDNESNFREALNVIIESYNKEHHLHEKNEQTSNRVQNEIIKLFCNDVMRKMMKWMGENEHHCFCADEAVDTSNAEFLSNVVRQVTKGFSVEEFF